MKARYDFSKAEKGKFYRPNVIFRFPIYLDSDVEASISRIATEHDGDVQKLVNENLSPGIYEVDFDGSNLPSGVYYYKLEVNTPRSDKSEHPSQEGNFIETKKMVLVK